MSDEPVPTLFGWIGGMAAIEPLFATFYARVPSDSILGPIFAAMSPDHVKHVAAFVAEVFGGPKRDSEGHGGHPTMVPSARGPCPHRRAKPAMDAAPPHEC